MPAGVAEGKGEMDVVNRPRVCLGIVLGLYGTRYGTKRCLWYDGGGG